jgi:dihydroorotate dehydrogenase
VFLRLDSSFPAERLIEFEPFVSAYITSYPFESGGEVDRLAMMVRKTGSKPVLLSIPLDASGRSLGSGDLREVVDFQQHLGARGIVIELESQVPQGRGCHPEIRLGDPAEAHRVEEILRQLKAIAGEEMLIVASGAPSVTHALRWFKAGAGLVGIDTALYCVGPGLTKRIHAGLLYDRNDESNKKENECVVLEPCDREAWRLAWFWAGALGTAMLGGGILAMIIAFTRVMLPYDEAITGLSRDEIAGLNPRLLDFMAHDRVSLAGTMISCAVLYLSLAWYGMRCGLHWAKMTVVGSATAGFFSFFLFLGFGYFDPFHAFVTACLLQLLVLTLYAPLPKVLRWPAPGLKDDCIRTRGLWGQLLMICFGVALVVAGGVISWIGMTHVFVAEDLAYLRMTDGALRSVHPWLVPLIAHDRAALGGMLMACGLGVWLTAQWGFVAGARWVWWTLLFGGTPAIIAAIGVHLWVGYTDPAHLAPAFAGAALFYGALWLAFDWLHISAAQRHERWESLIEGKGERSA